MRHHKINTAIGDVFQALSRKGLFRYQCHRPSPSMATMGYVRREKAKVKNAKGEEVDKEFTKAQMKDREPDFCLEDEAGNHRFLADTSVAKFGFKDWEAGITANDLLEQRVQVKYNIYYGEYLGVNKEDVVPLVFDTYGGYADQTYAFFEKISRSIAGRDDVLQARVMLLFRDRIAVALHRGQIQIVNWLRNNCNGGVQRR
jgi:hypothetical protein